MDSIGIFYTAIVAIGFIGGLFIFKRHKIHLNSYRPGLSYIVGGLLLLLVPLTNFLVTSEEITTDTILKILSFNVKAGYLTAYRSLVAFSYIFILWGVSLLVMIFLKDNN